MATLRVVGENTNNGFRKEITIFQYRKARILVWKCSYPCTEIVVSLYGYGRILVRKWSYPCTERLVSLYEKDCFRTRIYNEVQLLQVGEEETAGDHK